MTEHGVVYRLICEKTSRLENGSAFTYGIQAELISSGEREERLILERIGGISPDREKVEGLRDSLNRYAAEPVHFRCLVEDFLVECAWGGPAEDGPEEKTRPRSGSGGGEGENAKPRRKEGR